MKKDRYFKYITENNVIIINDINDKLESLDNETNRKFISLIRKQYPMSKNDYEKIEFIDSYPKYQIKKLQNIKYINDIYDKLNIDQKSRYIHWEYHFKYQQKIHDDNKNNSKPYMGRFWFCRKWVGGTWRKYGYSLGGNFLWGWYWTQKDLDYACGGQLKKLKEKTY